MSLDIGNLWQDLKRRRVFQVAAFYAAATWVIVQIADVIGPAINMPEWVMTAIVGLAMVGFPITAILAWLFDVTPDGVHRTRPGSATGMLAIIASLALLVVGTTGFVWLINPGADHESTALDFQPPPNSIAVLPFADFSPDKEYEQFADGISEVLIHQLSQLSDLRVIARTSSFAFKDQNQDMRDIGRKLKVARLLEGSVQRSNGRLRIAAQLIDTRSGMHVWSKLFDRQEGDLFAIQDEISASVANAMAIELTDRDKGRLSASLTTDLDAMELYLLGRNEMMMAEASAGAEKPLDFFNRALAIDPNFALAWSGLADAYVMQGARSGRPMGEALADAREAADRALALDEDCAEAYASQLLIALMEGNLEAGRENFERSSQLSPSYWPQYLWFGHLLYGNVRLQEATKVYAKGMALQPYKPFHLLKHAYANVLVETGEYNLGMRLLVELMNDHRGTPLEQQYTTALSTRAMGDWNFVHAIAYAEIATLRGFDSIELRTARAEAYLALGDAEEADRQLKVANDMLANADPATVARAAHRLAFVRGLYYVATDEAGAADRLIDNMVAEVNGIDPEATWMAASRAFFPSVLSLMRRRYEDLAHLGSIVMTSSPGPVEHVYMAYATRMLGDAKLASDYIEQGRSVFDQWQSETTETGMDYVTVAEFQVLQGRTEQALASLEAAFELGEYNFLYVSNTPVLDDIRDEPDAAETVNRMAQQTREQLEAVRFARSTGNWQSLVTEHFPTTFAANEP